MHLKKIAIGLSLFVVGGFSVPACGTQRTHTKDASASKWTLVWSDEFNGPDGSSPDPAKWTVVENGSGFGNRELEYYTARPSNVHLENGNLVISARKETYTGPDGVTREYTSGRLQSAGHFDQQYGRFEARIKVPKGQGLWPAFWMLGSNVDSVPWPVCGEMDIMENIGAEPTKVHGSLHGPGYSGDSPLTGVYTLPSRAQFGDAFHVFAMEWDPTSIRFFVDDTLYETQTVDALPSSKRWVFNHPFFILFDLAVGGYWPGDPNANTPFPGTMLVDYVRVYKRSVVPANTTHR